MGYTRFSKPVGQTALYTGAKDSEVAICDSTGNLISASTLSLGTAVVNVGFQKVSLVYTYAQTAGVLADTGWVVSPIAGSVSGYACFGVSAGTARQITVTLGSAGAILLDTGVVTVTGTQGTAIAMTNTSGTTTVSAGQAMLVSIASATTAQFPCSATVIVTRTA